MIVWPAVYTGGVLVLAGVLCNDTLASRPGKLGEALRVLPGLTLIAAAAAARKSDLLSSVPGLPQLWGEVLLRADVGGALVWAFAVAFFTPFAPATPLGQFLRGLVAGGYRDHQDASSPRTAAETAGAALSPLALLSILFAPGPFKAAVPTAVVVALVALVVTNGAKRTFKPSASPLERAAFGMAAVALAHLGGAFAQLQQERATPIVVASAALAVGAFCDPLIAAIAVSRALPLAPSWEPSVPLIAAGLWVGRAAFVAARAALAGRT